MTNATLPEGLTAYKRTPTFDQETLPAGLRRQHSTKAGVWALIHVVEGSLRYRILDPPSEQILTAAAPGIVRPGQLHEVEPLGPVSMFVEFYSAGNAEGSPHTSQIV
ncbi:MAG TPA: DUF1971 domain-containing protein [Steroidobacteraceae bacterium]|nr:DUF1971 domain-containing protein [Steroidobacteraceae bacterium]